MPKSTFHLKLRPKIRNVGIDSQYTTTMLHYNYKQLEKQSNEADRNTSYITDYIETVDHIISVCPLLVKFEYKYRHDGVGSFNNWTICQHEKKTHVRRYKHIPSKVQYNYQYKPTKSLELIAQTSKASIGQKHRFKCPPATQKSKR